MSWNISLVGMRPMRCDGDLLKDALLHFSKVKGIPDNGYLIVSKKGEGEFQLVITSGTIWHKEESLFGDPNKIPMEFKETADAESPEALSGLIAPHADGALTQYPFMAKVMISIAFIALVGTLISAIILLLDGRTASSLSRLVAGLTQMAVLLALAEMLAYLDRIENRR